MNPKPAPVSASLYKKREAIHPRHIKGTFASLRVLAAFVLLGLYYIVPWLQYDGRQAILFDLPARKFYLFGLTLWPQDFIYLAALLIVAALSLFFFTALAGRLWCGYACPQTVWTEVFMWIERKIEGDRNKRIKLDAEPRNIRKTGLKTLKHGIWMLVSLWTGYTFVGYFTPIIELGYKILSVETGPWETFWVLFYGFATYGNAGWMREQVCLYMCPYARFQSAMFDKDTLVISYDARRGEPRGYRKTSTNLKTPGLENASKINKAEGNCVDCSLCVQVCPTGIDIRDGLQYQCIGCAACIDACDGVMEKLDYPKGLIRYTTENAMKSGKLKILRPRVIFYGVVLLLLTGGLMTGLATRSLAGLDIIRDRNVLHRISDEGMVENIYVLKVLNKDRIDHEYRIGVAGEFGFELNSPDAVFVATGNVQEFAVTVLVDPVEMPSLSTEIIISLESVDNPDIRVSSKARFLRPR